MALEYFFHYSLQIYIKGPFTKTCWGWCKRGPLKILTLPGDLKKWPHIFLGNLSLYDFLWGSSIIFMPKKRGPWNFWGLKGGRKKIALIFFLHHALLTIVWERSLNRVQKAFCFLLSVSQNTSRSFFFVLFCFLFCPRFQIDKFIDLSTQSMMDADASRSLHPSLFTSLIIWLKRQKCLR